MPPTDRTFRTGTLPAFATQGLVFISLTTRLPTFSNRWGLSEVDLSLLLASLVVRLAGDTLVERYGAVPVLGVGAVVASAGPWLSWWPPR